MGIRRKTAVLIALIYLSAPLSALAGVKPVCAHHDMAHRQQAGNHNHRHPAPHVQEIPNTGSGESQKACNHADGHCLHHQKQCKTVCEIKCDRTKKQGEMIFTHSMDSLLASAPAIEPPGEFSFLLSRSITCLNGFYKIVEHPPAA